MRVHLWRVSYLQAFQKRVVSVDKVIQKQVTLQKSCSESIPTKARVEIYSKWFSCTEIYSRQSSRRDLLQIERTLNGELNGIHAIIDSAICDAVCQFMRE